MKIVKSCNIQSFLNSIPAKPMSPYNVLRDKIEQQYTQVGKVVALQPLNSRDGWLKRFGRIDYKILAINKLNQGPAIDTIRVCKLWTKAQTKVDKVYDTFVHIVYDPYICNGNHNIISMSASNMMIDICDRCGYEPNQLVMQHYPNIIW